MLVIQQLRTTLISWEKSTITQQIDAVHSAIRRRVRGNYGFVADPSRSVSYNTCIHYGQLPAWHIFQKASNLVFHNLTGKQLPPSVFSLLGLGLNFIPTPKFTPQKLGFDLVRFKRDFYTYVKCAGYDANDDDRPAHWFRKKRTDTPDAYDSFVTDEISVRLSAFLRQANKLANNGHRLRSNLLPQQRAGLRFLKSRRDLIVWNTDKNLGPAVSTRQQYYDLIHRDHLSDRDTYRELSPTEANRRLKAICYGIRKLLQTHFSRTVMHYGKEEIRLTQSGDYIQKTVENSLQIGLDAFLTDGVLPPKAHPFAYFYALAKIHKPTLKTRPITSVSGSLLHGLGRWLDVQLKRVVAKLDYVSTSSTSLVAELQALPPLPPNAVLFTADARSFYTNVDTQHALTVISDFFDSPDFEALNCRVNGPAVLAALKLLMRHSLFKFDGKTYVQLTGTAMGTPPAPMYATLYFFLHERLIIPSCPHLSFYTRYIDDAFGIWVPPPDAPDAHWASFVDSFDGFGKLQWDFSPLASTAVFLDLSLTIRDGGIHFTLYEKPQNLYLYIPPISCHPPGLSSGLVLGGRHRITRLCSAEADRRASLERLAYRLQRRGYSLALISRILAKPARPAGPPATEDDILRRLLTLHCQYTPSRHIRRIRRIFDSTIADFPGKAHFPNSETRWGSNLTPTGFS